jgi:tetratricopeptide (TPR) repeat protein
MYARNGHVDEAIQSYAKALEIKPDLSTSLRKLATMYIWKGDYGKAQSCCDRMIALSDKDARSWGRAVMGAMLAQQGKLRQALQVLDDGLAADRMERVESPPVAYKHFIKAVIYMGQKKPDLAVREAEATWQTSKRNRFDFPVDSRDIYVYILSMTGNLQKAQEVTAGLRRDIGPNDQTSMQAYWRAVGAIELAKGSPSSAVSYLEKGVAGTGADYKPWRVLLAQAYLESNRLGEAVGVLERQIPTYVGTWNPILARNAHYFLGVAYEKSGWKEKAIQQYQQFLEILKDADPGIAEVEDARARLARLKSAA